VGGIGSYISIMLIKAKGVLLDPYEQTNVMPQDWVSLNYYAKNRTKTTILKPTNGR